jgi:putative ABC transport system ATP-binding protein
MLDGATDALDRAQQALVTVGLEDRVDHRPREMSGGEQQRVAIARAIVAEPAVVFADEPIGNLDSLAGEEILKLLRRMADAGQTIIVATHDPRWAAYADRDIHLVDGRVAESKETRRSGPTNLRGPQAVERRAEV